LCPTGGAGCGVAAKAEVCHRRAFRRAGKAAEKLFLEVMGKVSSAGVWLIPGALGAFSGGLRETVRLFR